MNILRWRCNDRLVVMLVRGHEGTFGSPIWNPINRRLHGLQNALQILLAPYCHNLAAKGAFALGKKL